MRKKSLFLVLPVLFILSIGAQEPTEAMPEQEKQGAPEIAPVEQKAPEVIPVQPAPEQQAPKEIEVKSQAISTPEKESLTSEEGMRMKLVNIGLPENTHNASVEMLKKLQADEFVLYTKTWNFHWNVTGMNFNDLHGLFLKQYEQLQGFVDDVAERIRALGSIAPGTQAEFLKLSRLKEEAGVVPPAKEMIKKLLMDHEAIIKSLREDIDATAKINDMGTNNFLSDLITKHEKTAWMLRAYLEA